MSKPAYMRVKKSAVWAKPIGNILVVCVLQDDVMHRLTRYADNKDGFPPSRDLVQLDVLTSGGSQRKGARLEWIFEG